MKHYLFARTVLFLYCFSSLGLGMTAKNRADAQTIPPAEKSHRHHFVVNTHHDRAIKADHVLSLREALAVANGFLAWEDLSASEQRLVTPASGDRSLITFDLPPANTTIELTQLLPPIIQDGLTIDGSSQPGYAQQQSAIAEKFIPTPVVSITVAQDAGVPRGLTISASEITVKGLSFYGFNQKYDNIVGTLSGDLWIGQIQQLPDPKDHASLPANFQAPTPRNLEIVDNWLGVPPHQTEPSPRSAFGLWLYNVDNAVVKNNWLGYHDGSAIISGMIAKNVHIQDNVVTNNGLAGTPDAIRLEGNVSQTEIRDNLLCGNDGSGIYFFKTEGAVKIIGNTIQLNGRRLRRAAVFVMGNDHQIKDNFIGYQTGPGVAIAAYLQSNRNTIVQNRFAQLEGLSIDLLTRRHTGVRDLQVGDGHNPPRNSPNRRLDTANAAINSPKFLSDRFYSLNGKIFVDGQADPFAEVDLYQVQEPGSHYGPLSTFLKRTQADADGKFSFMFRELPPGTILSAIATIPKYGTSEPAQNAMVMSLEHQVKTVEIPPQKTPQCTTPAKPVNITLDTNSESRMSIDSLGNR